MNNSPMTLSLRTIQMMLFGLRKNSLENSRMNATTGKGLVGGAVRPTPSVPDEYIDKLSTFEQAVEGTVENDSVAVNIKVTALKALASVYDDVGEKDTPGELLISSAFPGSKSERIDYCQKKAAEYKQQASRFEQLASKSVSPTENTLINTPVSLQSPSRELSSTLSEAKIPSQPVAPSQVPPKVSQQATNQPGVVESITTPQGSPDPQKPAVASSSTLNAAQKSETGAGRQLPQQPPRKEVPPLGKSPNTPQPDPYEWLKPMKLQPIDITLEDSSKEGWLENNRKKFAAIKHTELENGNKGFLTTSSITSGVMQSQSKRSVCIGFLADFSKLIGGFDKTNASPAQKAEAFRTLATLYDDNIDLFIDPSNTHSTSEQQQEGFKNLVVRYNKKADEYEQIANSQKSSPANTTISSATPVNTISSQQPAVGNEAQIPGQSVASSQEPPKVSQQGNPIGMPHPPRRPQQPAVGSSSTLNAAPKNETGAGRQLPQQPPRKEVPPPEDFSQENWLENNIKKLADIKSMELEAGTNGYYFMSLGDKQAKWYSSKPAVFRQFLTDFHKLVDKFVATEASPEQKHKALSVVASVYKENLAFLMSGITNPSAANYWKKTYEKMGLAPSEAPAISLPSSPSSAHPVTTEDGTLTTHAVKDHLEQTHQIEANVVEISPVVSSKPVKAVDTPASAQSTSAPSTQTSLLSRPQEEAINELIAILSKEVAKIKISYPDENNMPENKKKERDIKTGKIEGLGKLKTLCEAPQTKSIEDAIEQIKGGNPALFKGVFSRVAKILNKFVLDEIKQTAASKKEKSLPISSDTNQFRP